MITSKAYSQISRGLHKFHGQQQAVSVRQTSLNCILQALCFLQTEALPRGDLQQGWLNHGEQAARSYLNCRTGIFIQTPGHWQRRMVEFESYLAPDYSFTPSSSHLLCDWHRPPCPPSWNLLTFLCSSPDGSHPLAFHFNPTPPGTACSLVQPASFPTSCQHLGL